MHHTDSGLYYLQSRYYDPKIGRFINADALVSTGQGLLGNNMFAYCNNSPVQKKDIGGTIPSDTLLPHYNQYDYSYGGGGGLVIVSGYLLEKLIDRLSAVSMMTRSLDKEDEKTNTYVDAKTGQKKQYQYWAADLIGNSIVVGDGLTFMEASSRVACGFNVLCADKNAAKWILVINCYWNAVGPERGRGNDFLYHYHPHRNTKVHIWFYGGVNS